MQNEENSSSPLPRTPEVVELRSLCAAAELGSVGRAAIRLKVSQPALSRRLHTLEALVGIELLERSPQGVRLTPAGRRLYEQARKLLAEADALDEVISAARRSGGPVRLAASHSAVDAFVGEALGRLEHDGCPLRIELVSANSSVVRDLVADGRADIGVAASRPNHTPYPNVREVPVAADEIVCAVPPEHPWRMRGSIAIEEFLRTAMVTRDQGSNSRWTVDAVLGARGLQMAGPLVEAASPQAARREAHARRAPILVSRHVLTGHNFHELPIDDLCFPRHFALILPGVGWPAENVNALAELLTSAAAAWQPQGELELR